MAQGALEPRRMASQAYTIIYCTYLDMCRVISTCTTTPELTPYGASNLIEQRTPENSLWTLLYGVHCT